jgi:uncharacterized iron-regulated protein
MKKITLRLLIPLVITHAFSCIAQNIQLNTASLETALQTHIRTLASEKFEGRETGTAGEQLAVDYIVAQFKEIGLMPKGTEGFIQRFTFSQKDPNDSTVSKEVSGQNVIGFLDNKAKTTIIIGAHLDHLGYGHDKTSLYTGAPMIHNGADDNASGTAAVIEMARYLKKSDLHNNNYLFIGFSGEEKGLIGSSWYAKHPTIDITGVNYMINMDMVGRLKEDKTIYIYGTGTSPVWNKILPTIQVDSLKIKTTESGVGPSDHTSFYLKDIPVLHFFSGFHPDYHKPSDDEDKINYKGEISILKYIITIITDIDPMQKIAFTKTKDEPVPSKNTSRPKVTLGIMPNYASSGDGLTIDGVTDGKPAAAAGIKSGDVITMIGEEKVVDMTTYMKALKGYNTGDEAKVTVKRGNETLNFTVSFKEVKQELSAKNYRIFSVKRNAEIPVDSIIQDMRNSDVLFFGEEHNDSVAHYLEALFLQKLNDKYGNNVTLSMEMFERDIQFVMNEYLKGFIRERNFKTDARIWSNYRDYRPMIEFSKEKGLDVICANAPGRYTSLAGRKGQKALLELPALSKTFFAPLPYDTATGNYHEKLMEMSGHTVAPSDTSKNKTPVSPMNNFNLVTAQSLWDATMAYSISEYRKKNPAKKIFQVNGRFHSDEKFAVVAQLKKYSPAAKVLVISSGSDESFPNIDWTKFKDLGDYIIITDPKIPKTFED